MTTPDTRPETRAEPWGTWVASDRFAGVQQWLVHQRGPNRPHKLPIVFDSKRQAEAVAEHLNLYAQPTQPDAVEALTYTIVEWGDLGPMCFTSQDANRVTLAEAKEALERILSNNPYNRRFTICAVHPVPSALTTDEEGDDES